MAPVFQAISPIVRRACARAVFWTFRRGIRMEYRSWMCLICGWIYDEEAGLPDEGIAPGTRWEDVPINWTCPECGARKEDFEMVQI
jgi:rubredoxin